MAEGIVYQLKSSPYSSHSLILKALPTEGLGRRVLDAGCSDGYLARLLVDRGYQVTGVERPGGYAKPFPENVALVEADLELPLPPIPGKFPFVLCADVLEHLRDPLALLAQLRELLEPGGRLILSLPNSGNIYFRLVVLSGRFPAEDKGLFDRTHLHFYTWDGWKDLLARARFEVEAVVPTGIPVGLQFPSFEGTWPLRAMERISYDLARMRRQLFGYQFVVVARGS